MVVSSHYDIINLHYYFKTKNIFKIYINKLFIFIGQLAVAIQTINGNFKNSSIERKNKARKAKKEARTK